MNVLIVYGSQYGVTEHFAKLMGDALAARHTVRVLSVEDAHDVTGDDVTCCSSAHRPRSTGSASWCGPS